MKIILVQVWEHPIIVVIGTTCPIVFFFFMLSFQKWVSAVLNLNEYTSNCLHLITFSRGYFQVHFYTFSSYSGNSYPQQSLKLLSVSFLLRLLIDLCLKHILISPKAHFKTQVPRTGSFKPPPLSSFASRAFYVQNDISTYFICNTSQLKLVFQKVFTILLRILNY